MSPVYIPPFLLVLALVCSLVSPPVLVHQYILVFLVVLEYYCISEPQLDEAHSYIPVLKPIHKYKIKSMFVDNTFLVNCAVFYLFGYIFAFLTLNLP